MRTAFSRRGFTLIELLTVIAIISVLAAILFPLAGTVREQARESDCMTKLHQLWVSSMVYKQDEAEYPATLLGYAEVAAPDPSDNTKNISSGVPMTDAGQTPAPADMLINGYLYREQVKDLNVFRTPNNISSTKVSVAIAHFPPRPGGWPANQAWIGDVLAGPCGSDAFGTIDCYNEVTPPKVSSGDPRYHKPKFYYTWDSYSIGPRVDVDGNVLRDGAGNPVYDVHYSVDWTGKRGFDSTAGVWDMSNQLKYANPPSERTLFAFTTWHVVTAHSDKVTAISMSGSAKKISLDQIVPYNANVFGR